MATRRLSVLCQGRLVDDDCYGSVNEEKERGNDAAKWC